jgi:sec-independent protein translocase protein TatB
MFEVGFSELLVIFVLALIVLGPEKLPRVASQVGRWIGRARAMARQFREQLEEEINLEETRKAQAASASPPPETPPATGQPPATPAATAGSDQAAQTAGVQPAPATDTAQLDDTYSHAHPPGAPGAHPQHDAVSATPDTYPHAHPTGTDSYARQAIHSGEAANANSYDAAHAPSASDRQEPSVATAATEATRRATDAEAYAADVSAREKSPAGPAAASNERGT